MMDHSDARLGILMLDSRFPRIAGDVGNPETWAFPVRYAVVPGATPRSIVEADPEPFVQAFVDAGRALVSEGCSGLATTCGFLAPLRRMLADRLGVPVAASALEQAAQISATLPPQQRIGILTISRVSLSPGHLSAAGVPGNALVAGMDGTSFAATILDERPTLDVPRARAEIVAAAQDLVRGAEDLGALLLECTNMVPYAPDIARATGRPVYSIYTYLNWFHESLAPTVFDLR
jgi:hypothetical protein